MTTMNYIGYLPIGALIKYNWYYSIKAMKNQEEILLPLREIRGIISPDLAWIEA